MINRISCIALLASLLVTTDGMSLGSLGADQRCRCIQTESHTIGRHIATLQVIAPTSHCADVEIIATLKKSRHEVCLNPNAPWVRRVIKRFLNRKKTTKSKSLHRKA